MSKNDLEAMVARLERVAAALERTSGINSSVGSGTDSLGAGVSSDADVKHPTAIAYEALVEKEGGAAVTAAKAISEKLGEMTQLLVNAMSISGEVLGYSFQCRKPADAEFQKLFEPLQKIGKSLNDKCDNRGTYFNNEKFLCEVVGAAMFVLTPSPPTHIQSTLEAGDFQGNKVLMKKVEAESVWLKQVKKFLTELKDFTTEHCKLGVTWNPKGKTLNEVKEAQSNSASSTETSTPAGTKGSSKGPPAPTSGKGKGPPPPAGAAGKGSSSPATSADKGKGKGKEKVVTMAEVMAEIEANPMAKLRKVQDSEKTKNRTKEEKSKTFTPPTRPGATPGGAGAVVARNFAVKKKGEPKGEPKKEIVRDNWIVENWANGGVVDLDDVGIHQIAYICNSNKTTFKVHAKIKSVCIDNCSGVHLEVQDVLSSVEIVNSEKVTVHCVGKVNTIQVDKTDTFNAFLTEKSEECKLVHSVSMNLNVTIMDGDEPREMPVPTQFVASVNKKRTGMDTDVSDIYKE